MPAPRVQRSSTIGSGEDEIFYREPIEWLWSVNKVKRWTQLSEWPCSFPSKLPRHCPCNKRNSLGEDELIGYAHDFICDVHHERLLGHKSAKNID